MFEIQKFSNININFINQQNTSEQLKLIQLTQPMSFKNSSSFKKLNYSDFPTAVKSKYSSLDHDMDHSLGLSSRYGSKIQDAKNSIGLMINQINNKKKDNFDALERVKSINSEAINMCNSVNYYQSNQSNTPKKLYEGRGYSGEAPQFAPQFTSINPQNYGNQYNYNDGQFEMGHPGHAGRSISLEQENSQLRRQLSQKIYQNNELLKRIRVLQAQNDDLRNQLGMGLNRSKQMRSTNYNSLTNGDASKHFFPVNHPHYLPSPPPYQQPTSNYGYVDYNKNQGYYPQIGTGINTQGLIYELDQLKKQNQKLRINAVDLLRFNY